MLIYYGVAALASMLTQTSEAITRALRQRGWASGRHNWTVFDLLPLGLLITFAGSRYLVGTDYKLYAAIFDQARPDFASWTLDASPHEYGFTLLTLAVKSFTEDPQWLFAACSAITVTLVYATVKRDSINPALSILLYVLLALYVSPFNIVRQGLAAAILFWASAYLPDRRMRWILLVVLAGSMHTTAYFAAAIQLLARKWRPTVMRLGLLVVAALGLGATILSSGRVNDLLGSANDRYQAYAAGTDAGGLGTYLVASALALLVIYVIKSPANAAPTVWLSYAAMAPIFAFLGASADVLGRMQGYFALFLILLLPDRLSVGRHRAGMTLGLVAAAAIYLGFYLQNFGDLLPYRSTWIGASE